MKTPVTKIPLGVFDVYRKFHQQGGGSKDWAIGIIDGRLHTLYGKTGSILRGGAQKPIHPDVMEEFGIRSNSKIRKGYELQFAKHVVYDDGSMEPAPKSDLSQAQSNALDWNGDGTGVFYEIRFREELLSEFQEECKKIWRILKNAHVQVNAELTSLSVYVYSFGKWRFQIGKDAPVSRPNSISLTATGRMEGAGTVKTEDSVYPLLFLLSLKRAYPEHIGLVWKEGIEVTTRLREEHDLLAIFGTYLDAIRPIAVALGLAEECIDLSTVGSSDSLYF
jgi:hypothetical protein